MGSLHRFAPAWWARLTPLGTGLQLVAFGVLPVLLTVFQFAALVRGHVLAGDFSHGPWAAGHRLFAGHSPYVGAHSPALDGTAFVYPAVAAVLLSPFSLLGHRPAEGAFVVLNIAALLLTLRALNVKDWRVYGVALMWPSVMAGWETGNVTLLLGLGFALVWRYRDRPVVAGCLVALLISVKLFVWPLALWLIATRRYRALAYTAVLGLGMNLVAWGLLGFDQIARYQDLVVALAKNQETRGYSLVALMSDYGIGRQWAHGVMLGFAVLIAGVCLAVGRRGGGRPAFALCVATCLVATPISWLHYFALLVIPLALARPRLSALWLVPLLLQFPTVGPSAQQTAITFVLAAAITAVAMLSAARDPRPRETVVAVPLSTPSEAFSAP